MGEWILIAIICVLSAIAAMVLLSPRKTLVSLGQDLITSGGTRSQVFLFDGTDAIANSHSRDGADGILDWSDLCQKLSGDFPSFPTSPKTIQRKGQMTIQPIDGSQDQDVFCEWVDGVTRVELRQHPTNDERAGKQMQDDPLRLAMDNAPYPVWYLDGSNSVSWCNSAYVALARKVRGQNPELNSPLFPPIEDIAYQGRKSRISITTQDDDVKLWFDLSVVCKSPGCLCYAVDINAVVDAEMAQRNFVQTLAKTFAQLSTGLAIFDRNRQLALFNPALIDLTALPADFLSGRPSVSSFFDRLRNQNMMPEPKNYGGWRKQMNDLLQAAADGHYQETWSMPSGSVYSISGRPHPDGAVAFLFEDITAEITLTRRFRSELEIGQAVLETLDTAIAVFAADGTLAFSNAVYNQLWGVNPDQSFAQTTILDATRDWQDSCTATPAWGDIREFVDSRENRTDWWTQVQMRGGDTLTCSVNPLPNGATMVSFTKNAKTANTLDLTKAEG